MSESPPSEFNCPVCRAPHDAMAAEDCAKMGPLDAVLTVCGECGAFLDLDAAGQLRALSREDFERLPEPVQFLMARTRQYTRLATEAAGHG